MWTFVLHIHALVKHTIWFSITICINAFVCDIQSAKYSFVLQFYSIFEYIFFTSIVVLLWWLWMIYISMDVDLYMVYEYNVIVLENDYVY